MALDLPTPIVTSLQELGTRLLESRKVGTDLRVIARDLLTGFFELCLRNGLDGLVVELGVDVDDSTSLADHEVLLPALITQLEMIEIDGGGPRNAKPRQLADSVVKALGLAPVEPAAIGVTLGAEVRAEVAAAIASVLEPELALPALRDTIIMMARARCEPRYAQSFERIVAQLDERGMQMMKQPKVPLDAVQSVQRVLYETRNAFVDRIGRISIDRAVKIIARADADAAARIDQPVTLKLTPREIAIRRASDARLPKTPVAIGHALLEGISELARITWRAAERTARTYAASQTFVIGDLIEHPKFGRGSVVGALASRIDVEFPSGKVTLVHVPGRK